MYSVMFAMFTISVQRVIMSAFATLQSIRAEADGLSLVLPVFVNKMLTQNYVPIHLVDTEIFHTISEHFDLLVVLVGQSLYAH